MKNLDLNEKLHNTGLPNGQNQGRIASEAEGVVKRVYTPKDISEILDISRTTTYDLLKKARKSNDMFKVIKLGDKSGDSIRVLRSDFDAWLEGGAYYG